jgi:cobaltochelatase CobS
MTALQTKPVSMPANDLPDTTVSVRDVFGIDSDMKVPAFSQPSEHVPDIDPTYRFDRETTLAILAGFAYNRRVMVPAITAPANRRISSRSPRASTGRACASTSTAISAASISSARTPSCCATASRSPNSRKASCPGRYQHNVALVFDEYDAGRPDVMFVIQRILESRAS